MAQQNPKKTMVKKIAQGSPNRIVQKTERDIAMDFAIQIHKKFDKMIKASILFGSQTKNTSSATSDIDLILIIDDSSINWDLELISWYREELGKLIASQSYGSDLHVNTIKLTTWWQDLIEGDPVIVNVLRYGEPLIDSGGFFAPLKGLLDQGKIRSTAEAVYNALQRAPLHLARSKSAEMGAIEGIYWAMIDSSQAALMMAGKTPPSPEQIPDLLTETFVDTGMLKINFVKTVRDIYILHKEISHGEIIHLKGSDIEVWQDAAEKYITEMTRIIDQLIEIKKD